MVALLRLGFLVPTAVYATPTTTRDNPPHTVDLSATTPTAVNTTTHIANPISAPISPTRGQDRTDIPQDKKYQVKINFDKERIAPAREGQEKEFYFCIRLNGTPKGSTTNEDFYCWIQEKATIRRGESITLTTLDLSGEIIANKKHIQMLSLQMAHRTTFTTKKTTTTTIFLQVDPGGE